MLDRLKSEQNPNLTAEQYSELTSGADYLLKKQTLQPDIVANSWLHILNEHPSNLIKYSSIFATETLSIRCKQELRKYMSKTLLLFKSIVNSLLSNPNVDFPIEKKIDVLLITQFVVQSLENYKEDFYYGNLPNELATKGISSLLIAQNQTKIPNKTLQNYLDERMGPKVLILPNERDMRTGLHHWLRASKLSKTIKGLQADHINSTLSKIINYASREALSKSTISNFLFADLIKKACTLYQPKNIVVLWEGHAWERVAMRAARMANKNIRCIGYQHSILFPKAHALKRPLANEFNPDIILTIGDLTRDLLRNVPAHNKILINTYGSHRRLKNFSSKALGKFNRYIILPDGIESECVKLFDYTISVAKALPTAQFTLRTHPIITHANFLARYIRFKKMPINVKFSENQDLTTDMEACGCVIYRGSSAVIYAVIAGLKPFYLKISDELSIDPLQDLNIWRENVSSPSDLIAWDKKLTTLDLFDQNRSRRLAQQYCEKYIMPPDPEVFLSNLKI